MSNRLNGITLAELDAALMLAATKELTEGMGVVYLVLNDYIAIDELVRHFYPRMTPYEKRKVSNCLKDYDPDKEAVLIAGHGTVKIFPLEPKHIEARQQLQDYHERKRNSDRENSQPSRN